MKCARYLCGLCLPPIVAIAGAAPLRVASDERFGVMTHFAQGWDPALASSLSRAGIGTVRDEIYWNVVEPEKGRFNFPEAFDRYVATLRKQRISPLIVLSFENDLYDGGATPYTPEGCAAYARYAVEVLRRYGPQVKAVEIWNEYNGNFSRGPATQDRAGTYLQMLRAAYTAIKRERPDVIVVGGATAGVPLPYWEKLLAGGGLEFMDVVSVHPYRYHQAPEGIETSVRQLRALLEKYAPGQSKPIWVTEIGWIVKPHSPPGDLAIDDNAQARFLARAYALLLSAGVERVYWYLFKDHHGLAMGLVRDDEKTTRRPAYDALATLIQQLRGAQFARREMTPPELYSLVFIRPNQQEIRVIWSLKPRRIPIVGAMRAVNLVGEPIALAGTLDLSDSPVFVTGPMTGLPADKGADRVLSNSESDFSTTQGEAGWFYGMFMGDQGTFLPLPAIETNDWRRAWTGQFPYVAITATDQHPSFAGNQAVAVVRRWRSEGEGAVRISGSFRCNSGGDGVEVKVAVDGAPRVGKSLGGGKDNPVGETFDFVEEVRVGTHVDFIVHPGPAANIDNDATAVAVTITKEAK